MNSPPQFIVVEGPIGVGKTSLARRLSLASGSDMLLEQPEENPFLERFYQNRRQYALPTQLYFLFQRARQMQAFAQTDLFQPVRVADFLLEKDRLFARLTLDEDELRLYEQVYERMTLAAPVPDLVIYLQAPAEVLYERIRRRGTTWERAVDRDYLRDVVDAYTRFFHYYQSSPLMIVNAAEANFADSGADFDALRAEIERCRGGRNYYNPMPETL